MNNLSISVTTFKSNGKFGLVNRECEIVTEAVYDAISPFFGDYARVSLGDKFGLINRQGKLITKKYYKQIDTRFWGSEDRIIYIVHHGNKKGFYLDGCEEFSGLLYNSIGSLYNDRALVSIRGQYGYINGKGEVVIPPLFTFGTDFEQNIATVATDNKVQYINLNGNEVTLPDARFFWRTHKEQSFAYYKVTRQQKVFELSNPRNLRRSDFTSEAAWELYSELNPHSFKLGTIDKFCLLFDSSCKILSPLDSREIMITSNGTFIVLQKKSFEGDGYSLYSLSGENLLRPVFDDLIHLKDDIYIFRKEEKYGLVRENGKFIGKCNYRCPQDIPEILELITI